MTTLSTIRDLLDERDEIWSGPNTIELLREARSDGLLKETGRMRMYEGPEGDEVKLLGKRIPVMGTLYPIYTLTPAGRAAIAKAEGRRSR